MITLLFFLIFVIFSNCTSLTQHYETVETLLQTYKRPFTCLEIIDNSAARSFDLAKKYPHSVFVVLSYKSRSLPQHLSPNVVVLMPAKLPDGALDILSRCEHFDVTLFDNRSGLLSSHMHPSLLSHIMLLGDHLLIESNGPCERFEQAGAVHVGSGSYYLHKPKAGLDIARWNLYREPRRSEGGYKYQIVSTPYEKKMIKNGKTTPWLPGINLTTFIMLGGIFPHNETIISELKRYKNLPHNDLVPGNFIIQGNKLRPIDFNDAGRRVQSKYSIRAIIKLFKNSLRLENPMESLRRYQHRLNKTL